MLGMYAQHLSHQHDVIKNPKQITFLIFSLIGNMFVLGFAAQPTESDKIDLKFIRYALLNYVHS